MSTNGGSFPYGTINESSKQELRQRPFLKYAILSITIFVALALVVTALDRDGSTHLLTSLYHPPPSSVQADLVDNFEFTLKRSGYEPLAFFAGNSSYSSVLTYKMFEKYIGIIEPSSDTLISIPSLDEDKDYFIKFTACEYDSTTGESSAECEFGTIKSTGKIRHVTLACNAYDEYSITVEQFSTLTGNLMTSSSGIALCMSVRRDISSLTADHLSSTMDAMHTLWSVSEEDGQALYGENFHSSTYFAEAHMFNAAQRDSDHIHEGLGFMTQHVKLTNMFELAIQAVDPSVTLPYWDYTYESGDLTKSPMFTPDTFGSLKSPVDTCCWQYKYDNMLDAAIPDGRWALTKADPHQDRFSELTSAYGFLRGPWNTNPSPYISRFTIAMTSLPACSDFYSWVQMTSMTDFFDIAPFAPHASTHGAVGGVYGCDVFDPLTEAGVIVDFTSQKKLCKKWSIIMKELYRADMITPKTGCSASSYNMSGISCGFECGESDSEISSMKATLKNLIDGAHMR